MKPAHAFALLCIAATSVPLRAADAPVPKVSSGSIERLADFPSVHVPPRHIDVWLPNGYPEGGPYDVLYMHDGQMLFDASQTWNGQEWQVDEVAGALIDAGKLRPFIVVGVWNGGDRRHVEYFPQRPFESLDAAQQATQYAIERDPGKPLYAGKVDSDAYLRFLVDELKPAIDARFRVNPGRAHTFVMGSSMGGLISMYALAEHPKVFGGAACLSTHWPGSFSVDDNPVPDAFHAYLQARFPPAGEHRIYFDYGTATLDALYPPLQRRMDAVIAKKGYGEKDWLTREFPGAEHTEKAWAQRLDVPLRFLFGK
jgi:predicted alpha/beta superfamily hydrolase